jgi:hypothetical protein
MDSDIPESVKSGNSIAVASLNFQNCLKIAGSPVPLLPGAGTTFTELAVDALPFTTYSQAWAVLGMEESFPTQRARLALRHLTSTTRCALTTLPAGKSNDSKAAQLLQDLKSAVNLLVTVEAREHRKKKKTQEEVLSFSSHFKFSEGVSVIHQLHVVASEKLLTRKSNDAKAGQLLQELKSVVDLLVAAEARQHERKQKTQEEVILCRIPSANLKGTRSDIPAFTRRFSVSRKARPLHSLRLGSLCHALN